MSGTEHAGERLGSDVERLGHRRIGPGDRGASADLVGGRDEPPVIIKDDDVAGSPEQDVRIEDLAGDPVGVPRDRPRADGGNENVNAIARGVSDGFHGEEDYGPTATAIQ